MTGPDAARDPEAAETVEAVEAVEAERRRRRARVFGEVLPETTSDDRPDRGEGGSDSEEWLRRQVPPHHG